MIRTCAFSVCCNLTTIWGRQKYCSPECNKIANWERKVQPCVWCGNPKTPGTGKRTCGECRDTNPNTVLDRICSACGLRKPLEKFRKDAARSLGTRGVCYSCLDEQKIIRQPRDSHPTIVGKMPESGEIAVYVLHTNDGVPFYVGVTGQPCGRIGNHIKNHGKEIQMFILRNIPEDQALYWECKTIVDYIDQGYVLKNKTAGIENGVRCER